MREHTSGPWRAEPMPTGDWGIYAPSDKCDPGFYPEVARCRAQPRQREANARLIAAAPDLLAACEAARKWVEEDTLVDLDELSEDAKAILGLLRAAIAKATGVAGA